MWEGRVAVSFGYPSYGWVLMAVLADAYNQSVIVHCSDVFPPFYEMVDWLRNIQSDHLPAKWEIDEEGHCKVFQVERWELDPSLVEFRVEDEFSDESDDAGKILLRTRVHRRQLIREFASRFARWLREGYDPLGFGYRSQEDMEQGYGFNLREISLEGLDTPE